LCFMTSWTRKRRVFLEEYLKCWNATEAARRAGYKHPNVQGPTLVKLSIIKDEIDERLRAKAMDADEVLARLADQARGDMADFLNTEVPGGMLDLEKAQELGLTHLIKSINWTKQGVKVELYDAQAALVHIGRHLKLFTDKIEVTWRERARAAGVDPDALVESLAEEFAGLMRDGDE
jgi:phage terminase small subunit